MLNILSTDVLFISCVSVYIVILGTLFLSVLDYVVCRPSVASTTSEPTEGIAWAIRQGGFFFFFFFECLEKKFTILFFMTIGRKNVGFNVMSGSFGSLVTCLKMVVNCQRIHKGQFGVISGTCLKRPVT